jgi:methyl-accepting chemotaxis protein
MSPTSSIQGHRFSLRAIFTGLIVGILLVFGVVVALVTRTSLQEGIESQLETRGETLAYLVAEAVRFNLSAGAAPDPDGEIFRPIVGTRDVVFVAVADDTGKVLGHLEAEGFTQSIDPLIREADAASSGRMTTRGDLFIAWKDVVIETKAKSAGGVDEFGVPIGPALPATGQVQVQRKGRAYVGVSKAAMRREVDRASTVVGGFTFGLLVLAGVVAFVVARWVTRPLSVMVDYAVSMSQGDYEKVGEVRSRTKEVGELADAFAAMRSSLAMIAAQARGIASGDLTKRVHGAGQLGDAFNAMAESLSHLVGKIKKATIQMASASAEILAASRQAEKGSAEQASSINETTTTMDELLSASKQIASSADAVAKIAEKTLTAAKAGEESVKQNLDGMKEISRINEQTADTILQLSQRNQEIGNIVDLIDEIADKSDLLALNAAIEGAKAGEAGKGFAVVATEMRSLAEKVVSSTKEIKAIISEIQKASHQSVLATESQGKATLRGTSMATRTGERLTEILQLVEQTTEAAKQISLSTQHQRTGTEQVVQSMAEIAKIAKANVAGASQTTASTSQLAALADELKQAVTQFRLGPEAT